MRATHRKEHDERSTVSSQGSTLLEDMFDSPAGALNVFASTFRGADAGIFRSLAHALTNGCRIVKGMKRYDIDGPLGSATVRSPLLANCA